MIKPTRREAVRTTMLMAVGMALQKLDVVAATGRGGSQMTIALDDWSQVVFTYRGKNCLVTCGEIFEALQSAQRVK